MSLPQSDTRDVGPTAVLIPLRSLSAGKLRLSSVYGEADRARLIATMASTVMEAAGDLDVLVVHYSPAVAQWAQERGAMDLRPAEPGLNRAISEGRDHLRSLDYSRLIVAHADLPHATNLRSVDLGEGISIVPDRHGDGTNVMCLPTDIAFTFAYGPGSFTSHVDIARRLQMEPVIIDDPALSWDVDHPDDLAGSSLESHVQQFSTTEKEPPR
jgi:2-phospho-L-lactate guanylyltransferase